MTLVLLAAWSGIALAAYSDTMRQQQQQQQQQMQQARDRAAQQQQQQTRDRAAQQAQREADRARNESDRRAQSDRRVQMDRQRNASSGSNSGNRPSIGTGSSTRRDNKPILAGSGNGNTTGKRPLLAGTRERLRSFGDKFKFLRGGHAADSGATGSASKSQDTSSVAKAPADKTPPCTGSSVAPCPAGAGKIKPVFTKAAQKQPTPQSKDSGLKNPPPPLTPVFNKAAKKPAETHDSPSPKPAPKAQKKTDSLDPPPASKNPTHPKDQGPKL